LQCICIHFFHSDGSEDCRAGTRRPLKKSMEERMYSSDREPPRIVRDVIRRLLGLDKDGLYVGSHHGSF
jgi:hypothetical protein